jgi:hypothetical protein
MDLQTVLQVISIVILSLILIILLAAIAGLFFIRKKISRLPMGKFGGLLTLLPILKFILSRRHQFRR